jgi:hypothetical protein
MVVVIIVGFGYLTGGFRFKAGPFLCEMRVAVRWRRLQALMAVGFGIGS